MAPAYTMAQGGEFACEMNASGLEEVRAGMSERERGGGEGIKEREGGQERIDLEGEGRGWI